MKIVKEPRRINNRIIYEGQDKNSVKRKSILIISAFFPPQPSIASLRVYSFAKYWARMGNDITVLTTKKISQESLNLKLPMDCFGVIEVPYFNIIHWVRKTLDRWVRRRSKNDLNCTRAVTSSGEVIGFSRSFLKLGMLIRKLRTRFGFFTTVRIPDVHDLWIYAAVKRGEKLLKLKRFDWIFSSYGPPASHIVAGILSKRNRLDWVADYRDLWIEGHSYPGIWPFTVLEKHLEKKYVGNHADIITTVSGPLANLLQKKFKSPVHVIENGYDEEDYYQDFPLYFKDRKRRIVYTGAIYAGKQDPSPLLAAIASMAKRNRDIKNKMTSDFEVLFFGSHNDWLNRLIEKYKVQPWVKYMGMVSRYDALCIQNQADVLLILEWENGLVEGIMTGKLFEYLALKKPILSVGVPANTSPGALIEEAGVGVAAGNDVKKIISILKRLLDTGSPFDIDPKEDVIGRFTRRKQAERLLGLMNGHKKQKGQTIKQYKK